MNRLKVLAHIFEPGPVSHERLLDACAWQFELRMTM